MNAPNFNFDPDGPSERLPALANAGGGRPPARETRIDLARLAGAFPENEGVSDYRRLFFACVGLSSHCVRSPRRSAWRPLRRC